MPPGIPISSSVYFPARYFFITSDRNALMPSYPSPSRIISMTRFCTCFVICGVSLRRISKPTISVSFTSFPSFQTSDPAYRFFFPAWKKRA